MNAIVNDQPQGLKARLEAATADDPDPFAELQRGMNAALDSEIPRAKPVEPSKPPVPPVPPVERAKPVPAISGDRQTAELENFLATGEKLLAQQRRRIITLESDYEIGRTKLLDSFRVRMADLENEANEAIRKYDSDHTAAMRSAKRLEDALLAMRG